MTGRSLVFLLCLGIAATTASAEEGMWTLDNFPAADVKATYGAEIDEAWLDTVRLATTRLGGCSGSFVSPNGLVLTNHHCARRCISDLSTAETDLAANGFLAASRDQETACRTQEVSVLIETEEITDQVAAAVAGKPEADANELRKQTQTRLEKACEEASLAGPDGALHCESVALYNGGQYFLYKYKRYDDVRLVFAPEDSIAAFGGDPDNFNFPRWCFDMALLRVYEDGEPISSPNYLSWRPEGPAAGEVVFVPGHPGSTDRLLTVAELEFQRDVILPLWLLRYSELRGRLIQYAKTSDEASRIVQSRLLGIENAIKVRRNHLRALMSDRVLELKRESQRALQAAVAADPALAAQTAGAWGDIAAAMAAYRSFHAEYLFLEQAAGLNSGLFRYARSLVRAAHELEKPNEERLREYRDTALPRLKQQLFAPRPVYPELEIVSLAFSLDKMREWLGPDHAQVRALLGTDSTDQRARSLVEGSRLADPAVRRTLWDGGREAVAASDDPFIRLALAIDQDSRALRRRYEEKVEAIVDAASERIASARFAVTGTSIYPDATFTLRVTFGAVEGWREEGKKIEPFTHTAKLYERATGADPFRLPQRWLAAKDRLDMSTRFNYVATTDITGGNSGSPMVDRDANLVGLVFDGNIHSTAGDYWFDPELNRTVAVHPAIMVEALEKIYGAEAILAELGVRPRVEGVTALGAANP